MRIIHPISFFLLTFFLALHQSLAEPSHNQSRYGSRRANKNQNCPLVKKFGKPPGTKCKGAVDPNLKPRTPLERWLTKKQWEDFFPRANHGWGSSRCLPYSYEAFILATRYFPEFGTGRGLSAQVFRDSPYTVVDLQRRDVAAFFAHVVQETGENNLRVFNSSSRMSKQAASECFYRGGLYHYFEGGVLSPLFMHKHKHAFSTRDGESCVEKGRYCKRSAELDFWYSALFVSRRVILSIKQSLFRYPCDEQALSPIGADQTAPAMEAPQSAADSDSASTHSRCYFGRGPLQLSWNYNYGQFQYFLKTQGIDVDLLKEPNLLMEKLDPPLAMLSALWFYMTPQPPKPSMHDIMVGNWVASEGNEGAGYNGSVFGPTSLVINNECTGEVDGHEAHHHPGENRRIKAFKWFCEKLGVDAGNERTLSCKDMPEGFESLPHKALSWQPDWANMWKAAPCDCAPAPYPGALPFYDPEVYPDEKWEDENERNRLRCVYGLYSQPEMYRIDEKNSPCLNHTVKLKLTKWGLLNEFAFVGRK